MILTSEKDRENADNGCRLIDLEIENGSAFRDPSKAWEEIWPMRSLEWRPFERLHVIVDRSDSGRSPLERFVRRITEILKGFEQMIKNQR